MSNIWMSHVTHIHESCHAYEYVESSHVTSAHRSAFHTCTNSIKKKMSCMAWSRRSLSTKEPLISRPFGGTNVLCVICFRCAIHMCTNSIVKKSALCGMIYGFVSMINTTHRHRMAKIHTIMNMWVWSIRLTDTEWRRYIRLCICEYDQYYSPTQNGEDT